MQKKADEPPSSNFWHSGSALLSIILSCWLLLHLCLPVLLFSLSLLFPLPEPVFLLALPKCEHTPQLSPQFPAYNFLGLYLRVFVVPATLFIPSSYGSSRSHPDLFWQALVFDISAQKYGYSSSMYLKSKLAFPLLIFPLPSLTVLMQQV